MTELIENRNGSFNVLFPGRYSPGDVHHQARSGGVRDRVAAGLDR
jgi:hypothetical protein